MILPCVDKISLFLQGTHKSDNLSYLFVVQLLIKGKHHLFSFIINNAFLDYLDNLFIRKFSLYFSLCIIPDLQALAHRGLGLAIRPMACLAVLEEQFLTCSRVRDNWHRCQEKCTNRRYNEFIHSHVIVYPDHLSQCN